MTDKLSVSGSARVGQAAARPLRVALLTREYPPEVYGGAGVHVTYLARELAPLVDLVVHCQGADRPDAVAHRPWDLLADANQALRVVSTDLSMAAAVGSAQLVHSHTWYANLAGHLAAMLYGIPHVITMHSLEVLRPWKAEQLGGGYAVSSWCERDGGDLGRRRGGGVGGHAGRHHDRLPRDFSRTDPGDTQRHRHQRIPA